MKFGSEGLNKHSVEKPQMCLKSTEVPIIISGGVIRRKSIVVQHSVLLTVTCIAAKHTECIVAFPQQQQQQWLCESATLWHAYLACLFNVCLLYMRTVLNYAWWLLIAYLHTLHQRVATSLHCCRLDPALPDSQRHMFPLYLKLPPPASPWGK